MPISRIGKVTRRRSGEIAPFVFAGVQILKPELFADTPDGAFSTNLIWDRLLESERLYGMRHDGLETYSLQSLHGELAT